MMILMLKKSPMSSSAQNKLDQVEPMSKKESKKKKKKLIGWTVSADELARCCHQKRLQLRHSLVILRWRNN